MSLLEKGGRLRYDADDGLTLIELLIVMLVMAILLAIAIPVFVSVVTTAKGSVAEGDVTQGDEAAKHAFIMNQGDSPGAGFGTATQLAAQLNGQLAQGGGNDPIVFEDKPVSQVHHVAVLTGSSLSNGYYDWVALATLSTQGFCYEVLDNTSPSAAMNPPGQGVYYAIFRPTNLSCYPVAPPWTGALPTGFTWSATGFPKN